MEIVKICKIHGNLHKEDCYGHAYRKKLICMKCIKKSNRIDIDDRDIFDMDKYDLFMNVTKDMPYRINKEHEETL